MTKYFQYCLYEADNIVFHEKIQSILHSAEMSVLATKPQPILKRVLGGFVMQCVGQTVPVSCRSWSITNSVGFIGFGIIILVFYNISYKS